MQVLVAACGIKFLHQQLNPGPRYWEHGVLATGPPEKSQNLHFKIFTISAHCHLCQHYSCLNSWWFLFACKSSVHVTVHPSPLDGRWSLDWRNAQHTHTHTHTHTHIHRDKSLSTTPPLDCKTPPPPTPLQIGTHSFEGISQLWPPLPGQGIKLFFSTDTSPQTVCAIQCHNQCTLRAKVLTISHRPYMLWPHYLWFTCYSSFHLLIH